MEENNKDIVSLHEVNDAVLMSDDPNLFTDHIQVFTEGRRYRTMLTRKFAERKKWVAPDPNEIVSHIPGVVAAIYVKEGQKVKKGEKLMIYEAMKMKNIITAPFDGTIRSIAAQEGTNLPKGAILMVME